VGLTRFRFPVLIILAFEFVKLVSAAPTLRLAATTVGPISVAPGSSPAPQKVEAYNAGDGSLALTLASSVSWMSATVGAPGACTTTSASRSCIPLQIVFNTSSLAASSKPVTGILTVNGDASTVDAPQTITVTVQVGGGVPSSVSVYVAPGASSDTIFYTNSPMSGQALTQDGYQWLTLTAGGYGSFQFVIPYSVHVAPQAGNLAGGTFTGSLVTSGSTFTADNKTIPVTMRVTTQPIAQPTASQLTVRLAQGAAPLAPPFSPSVGLINVGQGTLVAQPATVSGGSWITASAGALTFDPTGLSPGDNTGAISLASNAVNGAITVPVDFQVVAKGPPLLYYQGVQDNATFVPGDPVAPGDVMVVKGEQLSFSGYTPASGVPVATQLADTSVLVNGVAAPIFYSSYGQISFQMPFNTPIGTAVVQVQRTDGTISNKVSVNVAARAPKLLLIGVGQYGAIINQDNSLPLPSTGTYGRYATHPARIGDTLTIYAIGLGATTPTATTGAPAPYAPLNVMPTLNFGGGIAGILATPSYAGFSPNSVGLYQINVTIPVGTPKGTVNLSLVFPDSVSNSVQLAVQ